MLFTPAALGEVAVEMQLCSCTYNQPASTATTTGTSSSSGANMTTWQHIASLHVTPAVLPKDATHGLVPLSGLPLRVGPAAAGGGNSALVATIEVACQSVARFLEDLAAQTSAGNGGQCN